MEISRSIFLSSRDNTRIAGEIRGDTGKIVDKLLTIYTARSRFDGRSKIIGKHGGHCFVQRAKNRRICIRAYIVFDEWSLY